MTAPRQRRTWVGLPDLLRVFLRFAAVSGVGWLLDLGSFAAMVQWGSVPAFWANAVSSFVGITFVWVVSSHSMFGIQGGRQVSHLMVYWSYQLLSVAAYSWLLQNAAIVFAQLGAAWGFGWPLAHWQVFAKIVITPGNLVTNFLFMKLLARLGARHLHSHS